MIGIFSKTGGTNGKHAAKPAVESIAAASYIDVQIYEHIMASQFWTIPEATSLLQTVQYAKIRSHKFLCIIQGMPNISDSDVSLSGIDTKLFDTLRAEQAKIKKAMELFGKRKPKGSRVGDGEDDDE